MVKLADADNIIDIHKERMAYARALSWVLQFVSENASPSRAAEFKVHPAYIQELHKISAAGLIGVSVSGNYRANKVTIRNTEHTPPPPEEVQKYMEEFIIELHKMWRTASPVEIAAYALWRLNWIHPFPNGNGRTARLFSYFLLNMRVGTTLHGKRGDLLPEIIRDQSEYISALRAADADDLSEMEELIGALLTEQLKKSY